MKWLISCFFIFQILGCTTPGYFIENSNLPVAENRKVITSVIGKPRVISLNGRELSSFYHDKEFNILGDNDKTIERYYTKAVILGPRRPYEIQVQVIKELYDRELQSFIDLGPDDTLTRKKALDIKRALNKGLDNYQTLDGENPF